MGRARDFKFDVQIDLQAFKPRNAKVGQKGHGVHLQLRFEAPKDVKLEMLSRRAALSGNT